MEVATFKFSYDKIREFKRIVKKKDCVINAIQLLGIADVNSANIMRIMVGGVGLSIKQIEDIFEVVKESYKWGFKEINIETLSYIVSNKMTPMSAIFCGYKRKNGHVFLIVKGYNNEILYIDPQLGYPCSLLTDTCFNMIKDMDSYYVLVYEKKKYIEVKDEDVVMEIV